MQTEINLLPTTFSVPQAAKYIGVSTSHAYRLIRDQKLAVARLGGRTLVRRVDADEMLARAVGAGL